MPKPLCEHFEVSGVTSACGYCGKLKVMVGCKGNPSGCCCAEEDNVITA